MRHSIRFSALALALGAARLAAQAPTPACTVPHARMVDQVDDYHGTQVHDPYRWLENTDADETKAWVEQENCVTFGYLAQIAERDSIRARLTALWNRVALLPERQRVALTLRVADELEYDEIGRRMGCTAAAARANVYQATRKLRLEVR